MARFAKPGRGKAAPRPVPAPANAPRRRTPHRGWLLATTALLPIAAGPVAAQTVAPATGPTGGQVVAGQAAITRGTGTTTITQGTNRAAIDWQQFNVGSQHTVQFVQPAQGSWTLNRVTTPDPSVIAGRVQANGGVAIVNQSGVVFAQGAQVNVASLIASAAGITNENFMAGRMVFDQAPRPGARVENHGTITVADRGLAALVAPGVSNSGIIRARLGRVALGAAETFVLDLAGDGLINIDVTQAVRTAPEGGQALVTNSGVIEAPGGSVLLTAHAASGLVEDLIRQTGRIDAPTVGTQAGQVALRAEGGGLRVDGAISATGGADQRGGSIALQGSGRVAVGGTARIDASGGAGGGTVLVGTTGRGRNQTMARTTVVERGAEIRADATGAGDGGMLVINSLERTEMYGALSARGGPAGGNGGFVEISGQGVLEVSGTVDLRAPAGSSGELLIDPQNIIVSDTVFTPGAQPGDPPISAPAGLPADETITVQITTAAASFTATNTADPATTWTRVSTGAITGFNGSVTLDASRDIIVDSAINKTNGGLTLTAGRDVLTNASISVSNAGNVQADMTVTAGRNATIGAALTATGTVTISADTAIALNGAVTARNLVLNSNGAITQTAAFTLGGGGPATPNGRLTIRGTDGANASAAGSVTLTEANELRAIDAFASGAIAITGGYGQPVTLRDVRGNGITLTGAGSNGGFQTLNDAGPGVVGSGTGNVAIVGAALNVGSGTTVSAPNGATLSLRVDDLTIGAATGGGTPLPAGVVSAGTTGTVEIGPFTATNAIQIGTGGNPANTIEFAVPLLQSITAGTLRIGQTTVGASTVRANGLTVESAFASTPSLSLVSRNGITVQANLSAPNLRLETTGGGITFNNNTTTTANGTANRAIALISAAGITQTGNATLAATGGAASLTATAGTGNLVLRGTGAYNLVDGGLAAPAGASGPVSLYAAAGNVSLTATGAVTVSAAVEAAGAGTSAALSGTALTLNAPVLTSGAAGTAVTLTATGPAAAGTISQGSGGGVTAATLNVSATGAVTLDAPGNAIGALGTVAYAGSFALRNATGLTIGSELRATGGGNSDIALAVTTGNLLLQAPVNAGTGSVSFQATAGDITQNAAGALVTAGTLTVWAGGNASLAPTAGNAVGALGTVSVGGSFGFNAAGNLNIIGTVANTTDTNAATIRSGGTLDLDTTGAIRFATISLASSGAMTLAGALGVPTVNPALPTSIVRLGSGAGISQTGGQIRAAQLGVSAAGAVDLRPGTGLENQIRLLAATTTGTFRADTAGTLDTGSVTAVPLAAGGTATVTGVQGSSVTLSAADLRLTATAGVEATAAEGTVRLFADRLVADSNILAGGAAGTGTILLAPRTDTRGIIINPLVADATRLQIGTAALPFSRLVADTLVVGNADAAAGTVTNGNLRVDGGTFFPGNLGSVTLQGGTVTVAGAVLTGAAGGELTLRALTGDVTQSVTSVITTDRLVALADRGSVLLDTAQNAALAVAGGVGSALTTAEAAGLVFAYRNAGLVNIAAPGIDADGATVRLTSVLDSITQAAGAPIIAASLIAGAPGDVFLHAGGAGVPGAGDLNHIATLTSVSGNSIVVRNADPMTIVDSIATGNLFGTGGGISLLEAPGLTLTGNVTSQFLTLRTGASFDAPAAGDITQTGGVITALALSASAGGNITLGQANRVGVLFRGYSELGFLTPAFESANSIVTGAGGTFLLRQDTPASGQPLTIFAPVSVGTGGTIRLFTDAITVDGSIPAPDPVFLAPGGTVQFSPFTSTATIGLGGNPLFNPDTVTYSAASLERAVADRLVIGGIAGTVGGFGGFDPANAGTITIRSNLDLTSLAGLELRTGGNIVGQGFQVLVNDFSAYALGNIDIGSTTSSFGRIAVGSAGAAALGTAMLAGGTINLTAAGTLNIDGVIRAGSAGTSPTLRLEAADFAITSNGGVQALPGSSGVIQIAGTAPGGITLGTTLTQAEIDRIDASGGTLQVVAPSIGISGAIGFDNARVSDLVLFANSTNIIQDAGSTLSVGTLGRLQAIAVGGIDIDQTGNVLPRLLALANQDVSVATTGTMEVLEGTRSIGASLTLSAGSLTLSGTAGAFAAQAATTLNLTATAGDITGGALVAGVSAPTLNATASGAITLQAANNAVGTLVATAGTGVTYRDADALTATATGAGGTAIAGNVSLNAGSLQLNDVLSTGTVTLAATSGSIQQLAGSEIDAALLTATAPGSVLLSGQNAIADLGTITATTGSITIRNTLDMAVDGVTVLNVGAGQAITLEAPNLTIANDLTTGAGGLIRLRTGSFNGGTATGGNITQTGGIITTPTLAAAAGGNITLDQGGNRIGTLGSGLSADGLTDLGALRAGGNVTLRSNGFTGTTLAITGSVQAGTGGTPAAGDGSVVTLRADDFAISAPISVPDGTITLLPVTADGSISYVLGGTAGSALGGFIWLDTTELARFSSAAPAAVLSLGQTGASGTDFVYVIGDATTPASLMDGVTPRVGELRLAGNGSVFQFGGSVLAVDAVSANFPTGSVLLNPGTGANAIRALAGVVANATVDIRTGGTLALRDGGAGDAISVAGGGTVTLRADDLDIQARIRAPGGTVNLLPETLGRQVTVGGTLAGTLSLTAVELGRIGGSGADLASPGATVLRIGSNGTTRSAGDIVVVGDVPLRSGTAERVERLELVAGTPGIPGGSVTQTGGSIDVAVLGGSAQGDFRLPLLTNTFETLTSISAGSFPSIGAPGVIDLGTAGDFTATGVSSTVSVRLAAGGTLSAGLISAPAVVLEGGTITLTDTITGTGSVTLDSTGAITQAPGALLNTNTLVVLDAGSITLGEDNAILFLGNLTASGPVLALNTTQALQVNGAVAVDGSLSLTSDLGLTVAAGATIGVTGTPGSATLTAGEGISYAGGLSTSGGATLTAGTTLSFTGTASIGGAATFEAQAGAMTLGGTIGTNAGFTATAGTTLGTTANVTAGGAVQMEAGGILTAGGTIRSTGGDVLLTGAGISATGTIIADAAATLDAIAGAVTLGGTLTAGDAATVTATGAISTTATVTGATVTFDAGTLLTANGTMSATAGDISLTGGTGVAANGGFTATGGIVVAATTGNASLAGTLGAGGVVEVTGAGDIGSTAQVIAAGNATFDAGGTLSVSNLIRSTGGDVSLTGGTGLTATGTIEANGDATLAAITGALSLVGTLTTGGIAEVTAGGAITTSALVTAGGDATFAAGGALTASNVISSTGGDVALSGGSGVSLPGQVVAAGGATVGSAAGPVSITGTITADDVTVSAAGTLSSTGTVQAGQEIAFTSGGQMTLGGTHQGGTAITFTAGGGIAAGGTLASGGAVALAANGGALAQSGTITGGTLVLSAAGEILQTGTVQAGGTAQITAGSTLDNRALITAGGELTLTAGGTLSQTGTVLGGGVVNLAAGGNANLSGQTTAGTDLNLTAGGVAGMADGKITAFGDISIIAGQGVNLQSFQIDPVTILMQTGGGMNIVDSGLVASDSITLRGSSITLRRSTFTTGELDVDSTGSLTLDGGLFTIGRAVVFSGPSGITTQNTVLIRPRDGLRPAVVFDTRQSGITPEPIDLVDPDVPGLPTRQQETQVRIPGTEVPGTFGPVSSAPGGTVVLNLDAALSPVFLLIDGGSATGTIVSAGRLGIHGIGGSAELSGFLADQNGNLVGGAAAARFADSTRPATSGALTRFRMNGCVVSSINCIVPSQVLSIPQAPPQQVDIRLFGNRITDPDVQIPNVAEEDY